MRIEGDMNFGVAIGVWEIIRGYEAGYGRYARTVTEDDIGKR